MNSNQKIVLWLGVLSYFVLAIILLGPGEILFRHARIPIISLTVLWALLYSVAITLGGWKKKWLWPQALLGLFSIYVLFWQITHCHPTAGFCIA
jgi:hypothetical protein